MFFILETLISQAMCRTLLEDSLAGRHEQWMVQYGRSYKDSAEKEKRFKIFKDNIEYIDKFNNEGNRTFKLSANVFADLTNEEFVASHTGYKISSQPSSLKAKSFKYENLTEIPMTMDWREKGAVTSIKDQGRCGKRITVPNTHKFGFNSRNYCSHKNISLIIDSYTRRMLLGLFSSGSRRRDHPNQNWQLDLFV